MHRKLWFALASALLILLTACGGGGGSDDITTGGGDVSKTYLTISPSTVELNSTKDSTTISVYCNTSWEVKSEESQSWLSLKISSGTGNAALRIVAQANTGTKRTATLVFTGGGISKTCTVTQAAQSDNLTVEPTSVNFSASGETQTINISCETSWTLVNGISDWCTLSKSSGGSGTTSVNLTVSSNDTDTSRQGSLTVKGKWGSELTIYVNQEKGELATISDFSAQTGTSKTVECTFTVNSSVKVKRYGVCYSATNQTPTLDDAYVEMANDKRTGTCTVTVSGLTNATKYYLRPFVENAVGTAYGTTQECTPKSGAPGNDDNVPPSAAKKQH